MLKIEYIDNDIQKGIYYDFKKLNKEYRKLKCPSNVYNPTRIPFDKTKWNLILSERSAGKTTNILLYGMVMHKLYGTTIQYIRQRKEHIAPRNSGALFDTILKFNYVEKLTDGKYNSICYKSKRWYYCNRDENGEIIDKTENHFMMMLSIDENENYKSSYNAPTGDFIIYDEFLSNKYYLSNEFIQLTDLIKTIIRDRISPVVILLANMIDKHSEYFNELEISDDVMKMRTGENKIVTTEKGTLIYVELLEQGSLKNKTKKLSNKLFFGFKNPLLVNITGGEWAIDNYQHIPKMTDCTVILRNRYISHNNKLVRLDLCHSETYGMMVLCHWATKIYDDSIIYTTDDIVNNRYRFKLGYSQLDRTLMQLFARNKFFYATNDVGSFINNYIKIAKTIDICV